MNTPAKVGLVVGGYAAALGFAVAVLYVYIAAMDSPERRASSGMSAFSDALLFLAVFAAASVPATAGALFFLRPVRWFWRILSPLSLAFAATGLSAVIVFYAGRGARPGSLLDAWNAFAVLRVLVAPLFALAFAISCVFAPERTPRIALLVAAVLETASFVAVALSWLPAFLGN